MFLKGDLMSKILAYKRQNGEFGIRNHVLILPLDAVSCSVCKAVQTIVRGTTTFYHPYGRMQFGEDLDLHFKTLIGCGRNANVSSVIVVGIEPEWTIKIANGIKESGKPVASFYTTGNGDIKTIENVCRKAVEFVSWSSSLNRISCSLEELIISIKCGESDTTSGLASNPALGVLVDRICEHNGTIIFGETPELTGAEHVLSSHFETIELQARFLDTYNAYFNMIKGYGVDLLGSQPNEGNIAGGISTIEEKALGNIQKMGNSKITDVLYTCEHPKLKGLQFMDTSSAAADILTAFSAGGSVLNLFTTGKGNNVGNVICPTVKICANKQACIDSVENIDVDISDIMSGTMSLNQASDQILDKMILVCNGQLCAAEILRHDEFAPIRLHPQA